MRELLLEIDSRGSWSKGVVFPALILLYGAGCAFSARARLPSRGYGMVEIEGLAAVAWGTGFCFSALFLHLHFVWACLEGSYEWTQTAKLVVLVFVGFSLATFIYATLAG